MPLGEELKNLWNYPLALPNLDTNYGVPKLNKLLSGEGIDSPCLKLFRGQGFHLLVAVTYDLLTIKSTGIIYWPWLKRNQL